MTQITGYLVHETKDARLFRPLGNPPKRPDIWIPKTLTKSVTKYPPSDDPDELRLCLFVIEDWFAAKKGL